MSGHTKKEIDVNVTSEQLFRAMTRVFECDDHCNHNMERMTLPDAIIYGLGRLDKIAESIFPSACEVTSLPKDASGQYVGSLSEALMGVTAGLFAIANAIEQASSSKEEGEL